MSSLRARALATELLVACFSSEESGGFDGCGLEDAEWNSEDGGGVELSDVTDCGFIVTIGGHRIKFRATIERK